MPVNVSGEFLTGLSTDIEVQQTTTSATCVFCSHATQTEIVGGSFAYACPRCRASYLPIPFDAHQVVESVNAADHVRMVWGAATSVYLSPEATLAIVLTLSGSTSDHVNTFLSLPIEPWLSNLRGDTVYFMRRLPLEEVRNTLQPVPTTLPLSFLPVPGSMWANRLEGRIVRMDRFSHPNDPRSGAVHFRGTDDNPGVMTYADFMHFFRPLEDYTKKVQPKILCAVGEEWENAVGVYADFYKIVAINQQLGTVTVEDATGNRRSIRAVEMANKNWSKINRVSAFDRLTGEDFI